MVDMLMIADDMTGALDSGIALVKMGISTEVLADPERDLRQVQGNHRAIVINTDSRHMEPRKAYDIVYRLCSQAAEIGIPLIFKKTDSVMRGNIGAELEAALMASGEDTLYFAPAFPQMKRFTRNGVQYVDNVPIAESSFARDILNPIMDSRIPDIIAKQSTIPVVRGEETVPGKSIRLFDGETDGDLCAAAGIALKGKRAVLAGCAGFAGAVAQVLQRRKAAEKITLDAPLAVLCGSVHPASKEQLSRAEEQGMQRFWITSSEIIRDGYWESEAGIRFVSGLLEYSRGRKTILVETAYAQERNLTPGESTEIARKLPFAMGKLAVKLLESGFSGTLMIFGGDSLGGFIRAMEAPGIEPVLELSPGVVLSRVCWKGRDLKFITKAGSFGSRDLILQIEALVARPEDTTKEGIS